MIHKYRRIGRLTTIGYFVGEMLQAWCRPKSYKLCGAECLPAR